jgi:phenylalanyl-tRNA synthetase beta chain
MPLTRDFAFIVDENIKAGELVKLAGGVDKKLISNVTLFDIYQGKGMEEGKKSLGITLTLQPVEKTLTDVEIEAISQKLIQEVEKKLKGVLRG